MRPKRVILLVWGDEGDLSILRLLLSIHGYNVLSARSALEAVVLLGENQVDMVLVDGTCAKLDGNAIVTLLKRPAPHIPMVLLVDLKKWTERLYVANALISVKIAPEELLQLIKTMTARKRGPRKGFRHILPEVALV